MDHVELDTAPDSVFECTHDNYDVSVGATAIRLTTKNTNDLPPFAEFKLSLSTERKSNIHLLSIRKGSVTTLLKVLLYRPCLI